MVINGKYRVISILGSGSMGTVYKCAHSELSDQVVAVTGVVSGVSA